MRPPARADLNLTLVQLVGLCRSLTSAGGQLVELCQRVDVARVQRRRSRPQVGRACVEFRGLVVLTAGLLDCM